MECQGMSRKVKKGHGWSFPITGLTFKVRKVTIWFLIFGICRTYLMASRHPWHASRPRRLRTRWRARSSPCRRPLSRWEWRGSRWPARCRPGPTVNSLQYNEKSRDKKVSEWKATLVGSGYASYSFFVGFFLLKTSIFQPHILQNIDSCLRPGVHSYIHWGVGET